MKKILKGFVIVLIIACAFIGLRFCQQKFEKNPENPISIAEPKKKLEEINHARDADLDIHIFNRHRFAEIDDSFNSTPHSKRKIVLGSQRYREAQAFMEQKISEFNKMVAKDNAFWLLENQRQPNQISENLNSNINSIEEAISINLKDFSKYIARIEYILAKDDRLTEYNQFCACYDKLALRAYNDSLGIKHNNQNLPAFQEAKEIDRELMECGVPNDYQSVEDTMIDLLNKVATLTGYHRETLQAGVELALYNEGLFGLSDLSGKNCVTKNQVYQSQNDEKDFYSAPRKRSFFSSHVNTELDKLIKENKDIPRQIE